METNKSNLQLNKCKKRYLPLSESVAKGLEPEPKIQDFEILSILGEGSFGKVYLVKHRKTQAKYAIKAIDKRNKENIESTPYFRREIDIMYKIHNHPNIVKLFGHFEDEKYLYFIMEYISGGNLYDNVISKLKSKALTQEQVVSLMKGVISAVYYLHNMNPPIIHRDIKPENVLVDEGKVSKLTDFGWSNYIEEDEKRNTVCGTPIYLAPEIFEKKGHDEKVDIWCIGVLLFELSTGSVPFCGNNIETLKHNIRHLNIEWPSHIDKDARNLIGKILRYEPNTRIKLEEIISHPYFSKVLQNPKDYLIKPDTSKNYDPFIISKDDPTKCDNQVKTTKTESKPKSDLTDEQVKLISETNLMNMQKKELKKECNTLLERAKEMDKKMKELGVNKKEQNPDCVLEIKKGLLEIENIILKEKCLKYQNQIKNEPLNSEYDSTIKEIIKAMNEKNNEAFKSKLEALKQLIENESNKQYTLIFNEKDKENYILKESFKKLLSQFDFIKKKKDELIKKLKH